MSLFQLTTDEATPVIQRSIASVSPRNGNGDRNGHASHLPWNRGTQPAAIDRQVNRPVVFPSGRAACPPLAGGTNGHEAIARQDAADMACLCRDEDAALTRLMRRHARRLEGVIARILKDRTEAADVVEETFIRVHQHRHRFDLRARFSTWLYTIALNLARNRLRHRARQPEVIPLDELSVEELETQQRVPFRESAPDLYLEHEEDMRGLEDSLAALPPKLSEAVRLFAYDELSQIEISSVLHCSPKAVESRLYHARKILRADFERFLRPPRDWLSVGPFKPQQQNKIEIKT